MSSSAGLLDRRRITLLLAITVLILASSTVPVEHFISDVAAHPSGYGDVTSGRVYSTNVVPPWVFPWRVALVGTLVLFAAMMAAYVARRSLTGKMVLAYVSLLVAAAHYVHVAMLGAQVAPLTYRVDVVVPGIGKTSQWFLDVGQLLVAYAAYELYTAWKIARATSGKAPRTSSRTRRSP